MKSMNTMENAYVPAAEISSIFKIDSSALRKVEPTWDRGHVLAMLFFVRISKSMEREAGWSVDREEAQEHGVPVG